MIADLTPLTDAFMNRHPAVAARVLEALPTNELVRLFARLPAARVAAVLAAMPPTIAVRSLVVMDPAHAAELLVALGARTAAAVLRHADEAQRTQLLRGVPAATAIAIRMLLGFPEERVGSWADPDVLALPAQIGAAEALARVRAAADDACEIYVVEGERRLLGRVGLAALVRAPAQARLKALASPASWVLDAHCPLADALDHPGWDTVAVMPVVDNGGSLLGAISRAVVRAALSEADAAEREVPAESLMAVAARGYWAVFSGILDSATRLLPLLRS